MRLRFYREHLTDHNRARDLIGRTVHSLLFQPNLHEGVQYVFSRRVLRNRRELTQP
jgi:hypothetical protein